MILNIILYKCRKELNTALTKNLDKNQKPIIMNRKSELLNLHKKIKNGLIIHDGTERNEISGIFRKINKTHSHSLLFLIPPEKSKKFDFKKHSKEDIFYFTVPPSIQELLYLVKILLDKKMLKFQKNDYENIIEAYENVGEFSRKELIDAYTSLEAHETVGELSRMELIEAKRSLSAWEKVSEFSRTELINKLKESKAYHNTLDFSQKEKRFMEKVMTAWEHTMELARQELLKAYTELKDGPSKGVSKKKKKSNRKK